MIESVQSVFICGGINDGYLRPNSILTTQV